MRFGVRGASRSASSSSTGMMTASSLWTSSFSLVGGVCSMLLRSGSDSSPCVRRRMRCVAGVYSGVVRVIPYMYVRVPELRVTLVLRRAA